MSDLDEFRARCGRGAQHIPADWRDRQTGVGEAEFVAFQKRWLAELHQAGYAVPHWPAEGAAGCRWPSRCALPRVGCCGRTSPGARLRRYPPRRIHPAGCRNRGAEATASPRDPRRRDLGAGLLRTRSRLRSGRAAHHGPPGGRHVCGERQKLWASGGAHADWCLLLARTDPDAPNARVFRTS